METKILNYRIIVEPDERTGTGKSCYSAYCPTLGIADSGDTVEEAIKNIKRGIEVWIESLAKDGEAVPVDQVEDSMVVYTKVKGPPNLRIASA